LDARKRRRIPVEPLDHGGEVHASTTPETERARVDVARAIERAGAALPDDQRAGRLAREEMVALVERGLANMVRTCARALLAQGPTLDALTLRIGGRITAK